MSVEAQATYFAGLKVYRDNINTYKTAIKEAREKGIADGIAEGREIGREEGLKEGEANIEKLAVEKAKKKQLEIAKNCLEDGMSVAKIAKLTGLSEDEIKGMAK